MSSGTTSGSSSRTSSSSRRPLRRTRENTAFGRCWRIGLVNSPIACEGSRTGFYTDELYEQEFKSPEEIRKANLHGADLRGAKIDNLDFYLVDLRGALYTADQEAHFRRSGAILESRI
jgi:hypothetical protein